LAVLFLTAVRHPDTTRHMARVEELLRRSLGTLLNQTDPDWRCVVVCNVLPTDRVEDPRISYHLVDFPAVVITRSPGDTATPLEVRRDKGAKLLAGYLHSRALAPRYVMPIDSDDWMHRTLVSHLHGLPRHPFWYSDEGFLVNIEGRRTKRVQGLIRYCGSTYVYEPAFLESLAGRLLGVGAGSSLDQLIAASSPGFVETVLGDHHRPFLLAREHGTVCRPLGLRAVCWVLDTGQNTSGESLGLGGLPFSPAFCRDFGAPSRSALDRPATWMERIREFAGMQRSRFNWMLSRVTGRWRF
jgi:hypothetical protein